MKKLLFIAWVLFTVSCNNKNEKTEATSSDSTTAASDKMAASTEPLDYPYTLDKGDRDWQPGNKSNALTVLKALKAYENNNIAECVSYFGDSVMLLFDNYEKKLPHDSLANFFSAGRDQNSAISVKMEDWESVISKDKKDEWVTLWYKQTWTDKKGKTDSVEVVNDAKMVNGKIVVLDETIRHFAAKK